MKSNRIVHVKVSPYHPWSNGFLECKLSVVLFNYRVTPQSITTKSPSELLFVRELKFCLDLMHQHLQGKVEAQLEKHKEASIRCS